MRWPFFYFSQKSQRAQKFFRLTAKFKVTQIARMAQIMLALRQAENLLQGCNILCWGDTMTME